MRYVVLGAVFGVVCLLGVAMVSAAGPLDKDATSKERGNWVGESPARRGTASRTYSYAPQQASSSPSKNIAPRDKPDTTAKQATSQAAEQAQNTNSATRSFSYQAPAGTVRYYTPNPSNISRRGTESRFFHAERKALGEY